MKRSVKDDHQRAEDVGDCVLSRQGEGQAADAERSDDPCYRVAKSLDGHECGHDNDKNAQAFSQQGGEVIIEGRFGALGPFCQVMIDHVDQVEEEPCDIEDNQRFEY